MTPLTPITDHRRFAWLPQQWQLLCQTSIGPFVAGLCYPTVRTEQVCFFDAPRLKMDGWTQGGYLAGYEPVIHIQTVPMVPPFEYAHHDPAANHPWWAFIRDELLILPDVRFKVQYCAEVRGFEVLLSHFYMPNVPGAADHDPKAYQENLRKLEALEGL
ncbi:MAG: hypothetical protein EXQ58_10520 [Acidobacteria bacterium]|nr:hypothetical protein [Acidobacteriota bacterium]